MSEEIASDDIKQAWDRIARTADGQVIYRHFQKIRLGLAPDMGSGALRRFEGRRSLAADLMAYMAEGIADSDRYAVTFSVAKPVAVSGTRGAGRRVTADTAVPGWDSDASAGPGSGGNAT